MHSDILLREHVASQQLKVRCRRRGYKLCRVRPSAASRRQEAEQLCYQLVTSPHLISAGLSGTSTKLKVAACDMCSWRERLILKLAERM